MELFAIVPAHPKGPGKTSYPLLARHLRRCLLRLEKRLPVATFAPRFPSVVYRLLSLQKIAPQWSVVPPLQGLALRREA